MMGTTRLAVTAALPLTIAMALVGGADAQTAGDVSTATSESITIDLAASAGAPSGGEAVLTADGGTTRVAIELQEAPADAEMAGFLVRGTCTDTGEIIAPLGEVEVGSTGEGTLTAEVPIDLATIASTAVAVEVRSAAQAEASTLACGEHSAAEASPASPAASAPASADIPAPPLPNP